MCVKDQYVMIFFQPHGFSSQMVEMAFRRWIATVTTAKLPLMIFNGILIQFPLFKGTSLIFTFMHVVNNSSCCQKKRNKRRLNQFNFLMIFLYLNQVFIFFFSFKDKNMEFQLVFPEGTGNESSDIPPYSLIYQGNMNEVPLTLNQSNQDPTKNPPKWPVFPMLQYTNLETVDSMLPKIQLSDLG